MEILSPVCTSSNLSNKRYSSLPCLKLPLIIDDLTKSLPATTTQTSTSNPPRFFISDWSSPFNQTHFLYSNIFSLHNELTSLEQEEIDRDFLHIFNIIPNAAPLINTNSTIDNEDLMDTSVDDELSILDIFDPLRQCMCPPILPSESDETIADTPPVDIPSSPVSSLLFPYPIKLQLKLSACSEIKPFCQLVQQIQNEHQSKETPTNEVFYCKRVQRLTSQHIEQNQLPVTVYIFINNSKEAIRLTKISLQSTVSHILNQLLEIISFDYDQSILKLRSYEEYLRNEDVLCDIEYVHYCINSLKPLQFVLVKKPISIFEQKQENLTFEEFCLNQHENYFQTTKQEKSIQSIKILNKNKQNLFSDQTRSFISFDFRWLEEFHQNLNQIFEQIERCFNHLINKNLSINEQIQFIEELINSGKTIQIICSDIRSSLMFDKQHELKIYNLQLRKKFENEEILSSEISQNFIQLLCDFLVTFIKYIQTYCQAFLIPYHIEIYNQENKSIDIEQFTSLSTTKISNPCSIIESLELFSVHIDTLCSLPSNIKTVCVVARLCYGNETKAKEMTSLMPCIRNKYQEGSSKICFNQQLLFNDIYLCGLPREGLLLFEIYANFIDEIDSSLICEVFNGISMRLIGWCSQELFDYENNFIHGERYLGIIDATTTNRTGFYALRNIFDRDCPILTISFSNQLLFWPNVQARNDRHAQNFTEISRDKQEYLCRLLDRPNLLLNDHSVLITNDSSGDNRKQQLSTNMSDEDCEFPNDECRFLWAHRHFLTHKPYALPKLLKSRFVWDYPSLIDIYGFLDLIKHHRIIDEIESFELLLPAFPDMYIRSFAYQSLISNITTHDLIIYLPQLLQIIKFDYNFSSPIIEHLLKESINNHRLAHKLYWYLRQLLLTENIHFIRYYYLFMSLLYVIGENFRIELQNEYDLCINLKRIGLELKNTKSNKGNFLIEQLKELNNEFFQTGQHSCRLPCQFSFLTNNIDINSCSIFNSLRLPIKLVFNPIDLSCEKYYSMYKIGDDLRQDQIVLQLLSCMDQIWHENDFDFRLSLFNVVQTHERCGFIEMVTESETLLEIEKPLGTIKGSFGESALYDWLRLNNTTERDFRIALDNLTYSCAGYCVATYVLGIGDRHNENIMVKKSGHLFHIDFGKYLGDTQKFGWFNRDRAPLVFTKQMLYAMSDGGTSNDAMHRFIDLCCNAFYTLRQNSSLLLLLLSHLCSSNVPNLNHGAVRYVYDRLALSLNYAESITHFTNLIIDSLNSTWIQWNSLIHKLAQTTNLNSSLNLIPNDPTLSFVSNTYKIFTDGKIRSAQVVNCEKRSQPTKYYLYKIKVERLNTTYHYRTYNEFYEFYERLNKQFPLIGFDLKYSRQIEDKVLAQRRVSDMNDFLGNLFRLTNDIIESDLVCTFFHMIQRDQQINDNEEKSNRNVSPRSSYDLSTKIRIELQYDNEKLFVMIRHANNLPLKNGNEPKPYCKCYLFPDEFKSTKRKGKFVNSRNPIFNDTFTYEMDLAEIQKRILRVSVWNNILSVGNRVLGEVDIVLSEIDWSKENACDYALTTLDSSIFFQI